MSLFGDNDPSPAPRLPPVPQPQEMMDVIDEITGTQSITVTGADGKKRRLIQKLPRSEEEEALYGQAGQLMDKAIGEMKRLYDYDPSQLVHYGAFVDVINTLNQERSQDMAELTKFPDFNGYVQEFKDMQKSIIDEEYRRESNRLEETLAHKGLGDSTVGREERNLLTHHAVTARQRAAAEAQAYGEQLKGADLTNRTNAFNLTEATRQGRLADAATQYQLEKDYAAQLGEQRDKALGHQSSLYNIAAGIRSADTGKTMATMAPAMALAEFGAANTNALNYYNADVNRITQTYGMELAAHKAKPPGFGQNLLHLGGMGIGAYLGGPMGMMAGGTAGKALGGQR